MLAALFLSLFGIYLSGSRGSAVGAVVAPILLLISSRETRRWSRRLVIVLVIFSAYLALTPTGTHILTFLRLTNADADVAASDSSRALLRKQGWHDFVSHPINGIGWGWANQAHVIYVQLLAAGGILGLSGAAIFVGGTLISSWRKLRGTDRLAGMLIASSATWLVIGVVENQLGDQWIYVPVALLAAMLRRTATATGQIALLR